MLFNVSPLTAQDWLPTRIVGIDYPVLAIQARISGRVRIKCLLDENGKVLSTEILELSGTSKGLRDLLGKAAQENAAQWSFSRSTSVKEEQPSIVITYDFEFQTKANPAYLRSKFIFDFPHSVHVVAEIPTIQITK